MTSGNVEYLKGECLLPSLALGCFKSLVQGVRSNHSSPLSEDAVPENWPLVPKDRYPIEGTGVSSRRFTAVGRRSPGCRALERIESSPIQFIHGKNLPIYISWIETYKAQEIQHSSPEK